jgi:hypothetical protein
METLKIKHPLSHEITRGVNDKTVEYVATDPFLHQGDYILQRQKTSSKGDLYDTTITYTIKKQSA